MPYTHCPSCRLSVFSAAGHSSRDECPRCGTQLSPKPGRLFLVQSEAEETHPIAGDSTGFHGTAA
jgi:hypothetical protein